MILICSLILILCIELLIVLRLFNLMCKCVCFLNIYDPGSRWEIQHTYLEPATGEKRHPNPSIDKTCSIRDGLGRVEYP